MICPNCKSNITQGETPCKVCGVKLVWKPVEKSQQNFSNNNIQPNNITSNNTFKQNEFNNIIEQNPQDNEALIDAYIGKNITQLKNNGFSFCTLFFSTNYFFYRKMWGLAFLWIALPVIISITLAIFSFIGIIPAIITSSLSSIIAFVLNLIISIKFKKLYLNHVNKKVEKIKKENKNASYQQLIEICKRKGGTSGLALAISVIMPIIMAFAIIFIYVNIIFGINSETKISAAKITAKGFAISAEAYWMEEAFSGNKITEANISDIEVSSQLPTGCKKVYYDEEGKVSFNGCVFDGYTFNYSNGQVTIVD